ncbi:phosphotransferase enzyme family protein [Metabacillus halosaccharovorans]|uniref:phosphotransferase enzyme family protein n=1 Tax=Metabacillus halosaccharovorans TaxID=930124 RepID=UPI001C1F4C4B|nr:phosphotransferase [Metabacillus halosaccharovorans]MBU7592777.1 phosphotransferase [Metabacillus halosaccharovorans]
MKFDNSGLNLKFLAQFIEENYQIGRIRSIRFIPKGEDGYCYSIKTDHNNHYFVKAQKSNEQLDFFNSLRFVSDLSCKYKKDYVVAPIQTSDQKSIVTFGNMWISLYPFIQGTSLYETSEFTSHLEQIAKMLADFHNVIIHNDQLPKETFHNPFEKKILHLLNVTEKQDFSSNKCKSKTASLFIKEREDIEVTLEKMKTVQKQFSQRQFNQTITHGDPNFSNILRGPNEKLYFIDWGEIAFAPVERDLMFFLEVDGRPLDFEQFISTYLENRTDTSLHPEIFEFYLYRWCLQEIADYGYRLLVENNGVEEDEHSWKELRPYLPIPHLTIHDRIKNIVNFL